MHQPSGRSNLAGTGSAGGSIPMVSLVRADGNRVRFAVPILLALLTLAGPLSTPAAAAPGADGCSAFQSRRRDSVPARVPYGHGALESPRPAPASVRRRDVRTGASSASAVPSA